MKTLALLLAGIAAVAQAVDFSYDSAGRLVSEQFTNGASVVYAYDTSGNLVKLQTASATNATPADVSLLVTTVPASPTAGSPFTLSVTASNAGPGTAFGVAAAWTHPAGLIVDSISLSQGSASQGATSTVFGFGAIASGGVATAEIVARYPAQGTHTGVITVSTASIDPAPANNVVTQQLAVQAGADLALSASAFPDPVCTGLPLTYFLSVQNRGPEVATEVTVTNALSAAFTLESVTQSQGTNQQVDQAIILSFGTLAPSAIATAELWVRPVQTTGLLTNLVVAAAAQDDPVFANNTATLLTTVIQPTHIVTNLDDSGPGTLRDALTSAAGRSRYVAFDLPGGTNAPTINLLSPLPTIAWPPATIDGFSQPARLVELNGSAITNSAADGLRLRAGSPATVQGLVINRFPRDGIRLDGEMSVVESCAIYGCRIGTDASGTIGAGFGNGSNGVTLIRVRASQLGGVQPWQGNLISGNGACGVRVGYNSSGVMVAGNFIGTDVTGTRVVPNGQDGVYIEDGAGLAGVMQIGGSRAQGLGNVISGNGAYGVRLTGGGSVIQGNIIGADASGMAAVPNRNGGVLIQPSGSGTYNIVGGTSAEEGNQVSGNGGPGVEISGGTTLRTEALVAGNWIGLDASGLAALPNQGDGIWIGTLNNQVGDLALGGANYIAGNMSHGIQIAAGERTTIWGNFIGLGADGRTTVPNLGSGIMLSNARDNTIGGTSADRRNVISGNALDGVTVQGTNSRGNTLVGNWLGLAHDGVSAAGNRGHGVLVEADAFGIRIGGSVSEGNLIAHNASAGVAVRSGTRTPIVANSIFDNGGLGIDLGADGVTPNDLGDTDSGPNNLQNAPVLTAIEANAGATIIRGTLNSLASARAWLEFYQSTTADPAGSGEGETYLGGFEITLDASGNGAFVFSAPANPSAGACFTATASVASNTSEFSAPVQFGATDSDGDGIPDAWELGFDLGLSALKHPGDYDGDGFSDLNEYLAGTNPTNATSLLRITRLSVGARNSVTFDSSPNRSYRLLISESLSGPWIDGPSSPGQVGEMTLTDTNRPQTIFYRVRAWVP